MPASVPSVAMIEFTRNRVIATALISGHEHRGGEGGR